MKILFTILAFTTLLSVINGLGILTIQGPPDALNDPYSVIRKQNRTINFTVANFGEIPWGKSISAPLAIARYNTEEKQNIHDACKPIEPFSRSDYNGHLPIVLVQRGNCKFTEKARNVQQAGGRLALIYDNQVEYSEYITMGDDGSGDSVNIPSVFIREEYGEDLERMDKQIGDQLILLSINFPIEQSERVDVGFYINLPNEAASFFLQDFREIYPEMDNKVVDIYPVYLFMRGIKDEQDRFDTSNKNCIGGGRYCCYDPDGPGTATGQEIAFEQIRGLCVYNTHNGAIWLDYNYEMKQQECPVQSYEKCSKKAIKNLAKTHGKNFNENSFQQCVQDNKATGETNLIETQISMTDVSGVWNWPAVHINNITYHGRYQAKAVEEAICAGMIPTSRSLRCKQILNPLDPTLYTQEEGATTFGVVAIILGILLVLFAIIIYGYKRYVRREVKGEIKTQVNEMVSNYIKFYEAKQKDTEN